MHDAGLDQSPRTGDSLAFRANEAMERGYESAQDYLIPRDIEMTDSARSREMLPAVRFLMTLRQATPRKALITKIKNARP